MTDSTRLDEYDIRAWFKTVDLEQARDTARVVEGILEAREMSQPKRKRRKDAGQSKLELNPAITGVQNK